MKFHASRIQVTILVLISVRYCIKIDSGIDLFLSQKWRDLLSMGNSYHPPQSNKLRILRHLYALMVWYLNKEAT